VEVPFEHRDLVPQHQDFGVLVAVAHRQEPQQGQSVGHARVHQSTQHTLIVAQRSTSITVAIRLAESALGPTAPRPGDQIAVTRVGEVFGTHRATGWLTLWVEIPGIPIRGTDLSE